VRIYVKVTVLAICVSMFFSYAGASVRVPAVKPPQEILVQFKAEITADDVSCFMKKHGTEPASAKRAGALLENIYGLVKTRHYLENTPFNCYTIRDPSKIQETISLLKGESMVVYAQPNYYRYALYVPQAEPNDPIYRRTLSLTPAAWLWGFNIINADDAYNAGLISQFPARQIIVAVIDTGIKTDHEDIAGMTITGRNILNPGFEPYDDDISGGHGTHAAGIIGAQTGNSTGMAGTAYTNVSWSARVFLMPVKILDSNGEGSDADGAAGIIWAADHGANVINISVGGPDKSDVLQNAVNYAYQKGCVVVAAAGNNNGPVWYPAACANVISVAATDYDDKKASFSNYGKIDVCAPGVDIWSCTNSLPEYNSESGTSFAAPFVSGLAAMIMLKYPDLTPDEVRTIIERSAVDVDAAGYDANTGWGRLDMFTGDDCGHVQLAKSLFARAGFIYQYSFSFIFPCGCQPENL
jgi:subtilisin family serine protease